MPQWISALIVSISIGKAFRPRRSMMNLCRCSAPMQSHTRRWPSTCARLTVGLRMRSGIQTPSAGYRQRNSPSSWWNPVRVGARTRKIHVHSMYNSLMTSDRVLGFVVKHLHWVPHCLTDIQRQIRVDRSNELFRLLGPLQYNGWQNLMTMDESWFYLWTGHEIVWVQVCQPSPERVKHMIGGRRIFWNGLSLEKLEADDTGCFFVSRLRRCLLSHFVQIQASQSSGMCFNGWEFANAVHHHNAYDWWLL
jgi:hypothetical protein